MSVVDDARRQFAWRDWPAILDALGPVRGQTVVDLGCGVGDQAAALTQRGARVLGVDVSPDMLDAARSLAIEGAEFRKHDLRDLPDLGVVADGVWASFSPAYFTDLCAVLPAWTRNLRPGGWVALTEVDDLFGHEPVSAGTRAMLAAYAIDALAAKRYDFHMGGKLRRNLEQCGFRVTKSFSVADQELSFDGPAPPEVLQAWRKRLDRMTLLRMKCGGDYERVRDDLLAGLAHADHRSAATVQCCIAVRRA